MDITNNFYLDDFYRLCSQYVEYYPKSSYPCQRIQTWAAIESYADLNADNLGKTVHDRGKPFFFSRKWAAAGYNPSSLSAKGPLLVAFEEPGVFIDPMQKITHAHYNIQLMAVIKYEPTKKKTSNPCHKLTRNEIYYRTEGFIRNLFGYLAEVKYYENIGFVNSQVAANLYPGATEVPALSRKFVKMIRERNKEVQHTRFEGGINDYYGTYVTLQIDTVTCQEFTYTASTKEYQLTYDRGCC